MRVCSYYLMIYQTFKICFLDKEKPMNLKNTLKHKRRLILLWLILIAAFALNAQNLGDYRSIYGGTTFTNPAGWQVYGTSGWQNATAAPATPFAKTIYLEHSSTVNQNFTLSGSLIMGRNGSLTVQAGRQFTINAGASLALAKLSVNGDGRVINRGSVSSAILGAQIILNPTGSMGSILENYGTINLLDDNRTNTYNLYLNSNARLISGENGKIIGDGSVASNESGVYFEIANPGGYDEAIQLEGPNSVRQAHYLFNGTRDQVSGLLLPDPVFSLTISNPSIFRLSKDIALNPWQNSYFHIVSGSTVEMGSFIVYSQNWGNASFRLDEGATIFTAHPEGISSEVLNQKIYLGCIQTNDASYSSGANYGYNGSQPQVSGNFYTTPQNNTINNLIVENTNGLTLTNPLNVTGTITGSQYIVNDETLPVSLSSFNAVMGSDKRVLVDWTTQSETNCLGFYVLRSEVADLNKAVRVSQLIGAANSSQGRAYLFVDEELHTDGIYYYWLEDISLGSQSTFHGPIQVLVNLGFVPGMPADQSRTRLESVFPNPFNPATSIRYYLQHNSPVNMTIYNYRGQVVQKIDLPNQAKGSHTYSWDAQKLGLPSGVYLLRFTAGNYSQTSKLILSK